MAESKTRSAAKATKTASNTKKPAAKKAGKENSSPVDDKVPLAKLEWKKNRGWTDKLVAYLTTHPEFRAKLFSDSNADAAKAGRSKLVGKDSKTSLNQTLAEHVFKDDPEEAAQYKKAPARYTTSVETRLRRIKADYQAYVKEVGHTGAGIRFEDLDKNSNLYSLRVKINDEFPWFDDFHAFWKDLPNYNPVAVSTSSPGVDHAAAASSAFEAEKQDDDEEKHEGDELEGDEIEGDDSGSGADNDVEGDGDCDELSEDEIKKPVVKSKKPAGRDLGLVKAKETTCSGKSGTTAPTKRSPIDKLQEFRVQQTQEMSKKRARAHELALAREATKRAKYDAKLKTAQLTTDAKLQDSKAECEARREEIQLQIELLKAQAEMARLQNTQGGGGLYHDSFGYSRSSSPARYRD